MKLLIVADYNDADYSKDVIDIDEQTFNKFKPLIDAIENFKPYICRHWIGGVKTSNWESHREDLGKLNVYEKYPQFSKEFIDEFSDIFMSGLNNPEFDYGGYFHTIVTLENIITGEKYIDYNYQKSYKRRSDKIKQYEKEKRQIYSYHRKKDGKALDSIPYNEMTEEENELIGRLHNLWQKYV